MEFGGFENVTINRSKIMGKIGYTLMIEALSSYFTKK